MCNSQDAIAVRDKFGVVLCREVDGTVASPTFSCKFFICA
jgi:hypothetical protein